MRPAQLIFQGVQRVDSDAHGVEHFHCPGDVFTARAAISASAARIRRSLTVPSSPEVMSTAVTALRLRDRTGDLEFYESVVVHSQFAQHLIGVLGELWSPLEFGRVIVEIHRTGHQYFLECPPRQ